MTTDNPGGLELATIFGDDLSVVPRQDPPALAQAILAFLRSPRRAREPTAGIIAERFRLEGVADRYLDLYRDATRR